MEQELTGHVESTGVCVFKLIFFFFFFSVSLLLNDPLQNLNHLSDFESVIRELMALDGIHMKKVLENGFFTSQL